MGTQAKNISSGDQNIEIKMDSKYLVLIDLLVLDGLSEQLSAISDPTTTDPFEFIAPLAEPLHIGVYEIPEFTPGIYQFSANDLTKANPGDRSSGVVDIDTGELVLVDFGHLSSVAQNLTWDKYDLHLQAPLDDNSIIVSIIEKVGGPYFGMIGADPDSDFDGDGSYKMKPGAGVSVTG
jgi:hypothetical protein